MICMYMLKSALSYTHPVFYQFNFNLTEIVLKLWFFAWNMKIGQPCPQPPNGWSVILWLHQTENRKYNYLFIFLFFWVSAAYMFILTAVGRKYFPTWYLTFYHLCWAQVVQHSSLSDSKDNWIILKDLSFLVCFWYTLDCASYLLSGF